jgi:hypothetical protein
MIDVDFKFSPLKFGLLRFPSHAATAWRDRCTRRGGWQISGVTEEGGFIQS